MAKTIALLEGISRRVAAPSRERLQPARPLRPRLPLRIRLHRIDCRESWPTIALWLTGEQGTDSIPTPTPPPIVIVATDRTLQSAERVSRPLSLFDPRVGGLYERLSPAGDLQRFAYLGSQASDSHWSVRLMPVIAASDPRALQICQIHPIAAGCTSGNPLGEHRGHGERIRLHLLTLPSTTGTGGRQRPSYLDYFLCGPRIELVCIRDVAGYRAYRDREAQGAARMRELRRARETEQ